MGLRIGARGIVAALGATLVMAVPAFAQSDPSHMKACGQEWQAAKAANKVPAGQTWQEFYKGCNARLKTATPEAQKAGAPAPSAAKPAAAAATKPETSKPAATAQKPAASGDKAAQTPGQIAAHERQKECGAQWRRDKEAGKIPTGQTWPQYWSACNTRLKEKGK